MITVAGLVGNIAAAIAITNNEILLGGILVLLFGALDMLDGAVARATGRATAFGALLDSVFDRLSEAIIFGGILVYQLNQGHDEEVILSFAAVVGSILVSYVRARAEALDVSITDGLFTRPERVIFIGVALTLGWLRPALWVLAIVTLITVGQRIRNTKQRLDEPSRIEGND